MNTISVEQTGRVVLIKLNRPDVLNALNAELLCELVETMSALDKSTDVGCFVITGNGRAFAAGADIQELANLDYKQMFDGDILGDWEMFSRLRTPKIAAVNGYALGGGCELAMMCDMIFASVKAKFGQPEIKLGLIPGMGGSQRLTRLVGKATAMDMILTGRFLDAESALRCGLVSRVYPEEDLLAESMECARLISTFGKTAAMVARDAVNHSETGLADSLLFERRTYHALWATEDAKEGMNAFLEKREPRFNKGH